MFEPVSLNPPPNPDLNTQNTDPTQLDDGLVPPDPLLRADTFIQVDSSATQNGDVGTATPQPIRSVRAGSEVEWVGDQGSAAGLALVETPASQRRTKKSADETPERPSWLPENWKMEVRVRVSGATAGTYDRYYVDPLSGRKFRSKNEVLYYLETGSKRKKRADSDATHSESPAAQKPKKSKTRVGDFSGLNFDFQNPPKKVSWALTSASQDRWTPIGSEGMVPESVKREWDKAFTCISQLDPVSRPAY